MARTATQADPRLIALALPGIPESVPVARWHVRAALGLHGLGEYADDAEIITSELVTNAVQHACDNGTTTIGVALTHAGSPAAVTVAVSDSSPHGPIMRDTPPAASRAGGCRSWRHCRLTGAGAAEDGGKAVFAVLAREA